MLRINNHTVEVMKDMLGIYSGAAFEFRLDVEVGKEDSAYCEDGLGLLVLYATSEGNEKEPIFSHSFYNVKTNTILSVMLTEEEKKQVEAYCTNHLREVVYQAFNEVMEEGCYTEEKVAAARKNVLISKTYYEINEEDFTGIILSVFEKGLLIKRLTNMDLEDQMEFDTETWKNQIETFVFPSLQIVEDMLAFEGKYHEVSEEQLEEWRNRVIIAF